MDADNGKGKTTVEWNDLWPQYTFEAPLMRGKLWSGPTQPRCP